SMKSKFFFSLDAIKPSYQNAHGSMSYATQKEAAGLKNISFANLHLNAKGMQTPIWHPNANKIGYCLEGKALVSMRSPGDEVSYTVEKGEIFFIPQGYVHTIECVSDKESIISFALDSELPETMYLSQAVNSISENVFTSTFGTAPEFSSVLKKNKKS